jgi:hypothetical protein
LGRPFTALVRSVEHTSRLDQEDLSLALRVRLMFDTLRDHEHFSSRRTNGAITQSMRSTPSITMKVSSVSFLIKIDRLVAHVASLRSGVSNHDPGLGLSS